MLPVCREIRRVILNASHSSGHGHIPTSFSIVEMLWASYAELQHRPTEPQWEQRDLFLLSKGHASLGHYAVLAQLGYVDIPTLGTFGSFRSKYGCHPDRQKVPGVEASTGSLGHGIGLAVGMALGLKIKNSERRVFALIGDGESNEGSVWEAVMVAVNCKLDNLTVLYDDNRSQGRCLQIQEPADCFRAFGAHSSVCSGHDVDEIRAAISTPTPAGKPRVIVCQTRKGYGCPTLMDEVYAWHRRSPKEDELRLLMAELEAFQGEDVHAKTI